MSNKINKYIEVLNLFNEKADEIKNSSYVKFFLEKKPKATISKKQGEPVKIETTEPDTELLRSFVLTIRLFLPGKEQISFNNINKIYEKLPNNFQKEKKSFSRAIKRINNILDTNINIKFNNKRPTFREVLYVFIYGNPAHLNPKKRNTYKCWKSRKDLYALLKTDFHIILCKLIQCILYMQKLNTDVIRKIKKCSIT